MWEGDRLANQGGGEWGIYCKRRYFSRVLRIYRNGQFHLDLNLPLALCSIVKLIFTVYIFSRIYKKLTLHENIHSMNIFLHS